MKKKTRKYIILSIVMLLSLSLFSGCSVKSKNSLISYAKKHYGNCKFVKEETSGSGNNETRTVYLIDKDTGIEYYVSSGLQDLNIDGSSFGHTENTSSNFMSLYWDYVRDKAKDKLDAISKKYNVEICDDQKLIFNSRPSSGQPEAAAKEVYKALKKYDEKGILEITLLVYSENGNAYLGVLEEETWSGNDSYGVIDYVQSVFPDATYSSSIYGIPESYVNSDDMSRLISKGGKDTNTFNVEFFFFKDPEYGTLVAFNLEEISLKGYFIGTYESYGGGETLDCDVLGIHH